MLYPSIRSWMWRAMPELPFKVNPYGKGIQPYSGTRKCSSQAKSRLQSPKWESCLDGQTAQGKTSQAHAPAAEAFNKLTAKEEDIHNLRMPSEVAWIMQTKLKEQRHHWNEWWKTWPARSQLTIWRCSSSMLCWSYKKEVAITEG